MSLSAGQRLLVETSPAVRLGTPQELFSVNMDLYAGHDVARDRKRFLAIQNTAADTEGAAVVLVVTNWFAEFAEGR
jgi:hypothetical protein